MGEIKSSGRPIEQLFEKVLSMNILSSDYFRELVRLKTFHEVIDEIYVTVTHVEPWMTGNCRGPSTAYCLLYKFFTMKLTVKQMHGLLQHQDSPYIRAIGFLYLRYVADPKTIWSWYEPYIKDDEEFSPGSNGRTTTMGVYLRDLLLGQYYFDTLFPRIPLPVMRSITANLENLKLPTKHCGVTGEITRGLDETARRPPSVKASLSVSFGQRAPHRASTRDSSYDRSDGSRDRDRDRDRERERMSRESYRKDYDRSGRREGGSRSRRSRSRSRGRSESIYDENRAGSSNTAASSNLAKLKDLYGDSSDRKETGDGKVTNRDSGTEEVIRLGGSRWR